MASSKEFKYDSIQDNETIVGYLESVIEGIRKKEILFQNNEQSLTFKPNGLIDFDIKAKQKGNENRITIKLQWKDENKQINDKLLTIG